MMGAVMAYIMVVAYHVAEVVFKVVDFVKAHPKVVVAAVGVVVAVAIAVACC